MEKKPVDRPYLRHSVNALVWLRAELVVETASEVETSLIDSERQCYFGNTDLIPYDKEIKNIVNSFRFFLTFAYIKRQVLTCSFFSC